MPLNARLRLELLPDLVLPSGVVAIYDSQDSGYGPGTVTATGLQEAADDFTNHYGATDFDGLLAVVNGYVQNAGLIDQLYIFDHGNGTGQEFGNAIITPEQWGQIKPLLAPNAVIIFAGCSVGSNVQYNNDVATKTGVPVIASSECVYYQYYAFGNDFASGGTWNVFGGTADPAALGLRTETHTPTNKKKKGSLAVTVDFSPGVAPQFRLAPLGLIDQERDPFGPVSVG